MSPGRWLVTGGAGYIGAHVVREMTAAGIDVVVLDDLSTGERTRVPGSAQFVQGSVLDRDVMVGTLRGHDVVGVVHVAAKKAVGESWERPEYYYRENVGGLGIVLEAMREVGVDRMVLSSSAAVYGTPGGGRVDEECPTQPINPYGRTKLACEWMVADASRASGTHYVALRYFNAGGAGVPELGDAGVFNLIPLIFRALGDGVPPLIFGDDYPTPDGTCIRDYVHVVDVARAHVSAIGELDRIAGSPGAEPYTATFNLGRGVGASVKEVMAAVADVTGLPVKPRTTARRPGDPAELVGDVDRIARELQWRAERDLHQIVGDAWRAWTS